MNREIIVVGLSHRTAPVETREQVAIADAELTDAYHRLLARQHVEEGVIISTCNRVEVIATAQQADVAAKEIAEFLRESPDAEIDRFDEHLYFHRGAEAVRHVFRVASSLDSMVVGEPQILGQLKTSYTRAASLGATGTVLHRLFHKSFSTAKRVRAETTIASRAVSVASAAVDLARKIFERLEDKTAMLMGAGQMSELAARHLLSNGVGSLIVTNRTFERAVELAREFGGTPVPFDQFQRYLRLADVIIGSTAADGFVVTPALVHDILRERNQRPMFFIDLSVPRNFDPRLNDLSNVYLYDIDDLEGVIEVNLEERAREAEKAERLVDDEVEGFCRWIGSLNAVPTIVALRRRVEAIRRAELDKTMSALQLGERERDALEAMTSAIVNKILHSPISKLKQDGENEDEAFYIDAVLRLFELGDDPAPERRSNVTQLREAPMSRSLRLGTRGSQLALAQAHWVQAALEAAEPGLRIEQVVIKTSGDRIQDRSLSEVGGKGLFIKEIEEAMLRREIDLAVHSMKDLPAELADGLVIAGVPAREDPGDMLIARQRATLAQLPSGARIGTSSLRRMALLRSERPDVEVVPLRGNVDTRLRRLGEGVVDAIVLAVAGLNRLGLAPEAAVRLDVDRFVPAIGQGALAIETRAGECEDLLRWLEHPPTRAAIVAERALMRGVQGSCTTPIAAHARVGSDEIALDAVILSPDGTRAVRGARRGSLARAEALGLELADELMRRGGADILRALGAVS